MPLLPAAGLYLVAINLYCLLLFRGDKQRAIAGQRRIPESTLLLIALFGGTIGAFAARQIFRHKTRKQPFSTRLAVIAIIQIGLIFAFTIA